MCQTCFSAFCVNARVAAFLIAIYGCEWWWQEACWCFRTVVLSNTAQDGDENEQIGVGQDWICFDVEKEYDGTKDDVLLPHSPKKQRWRGRPATTWFQDLKKWTKAGHGCCITTGDRSGKMARNHQCHSSADSATWLERDFNSFLIFVIFFLVFCMWNVLEYIARFPSLLSATAIWNRIFFLAPVTKIMCFGTFHSLLCSFPTHNLKHIWTHCDVLSYKSVYNANYLLIYLLQCELLHLLICLPYDIWFQQKEFVQKLTNDCIFGDPFTHCYIQPRNSRWLQVSDKSQHPHIDQWAE